MAILGGYGLTAVSLGSVSGGVLGRDILDLDHLIIANVNILSFKLIAASGLAIGPLTVKLKIFRLNINTIDYDLVGQSESFTGLDAGVQHDLTLQNPIAANENDIVALSIASDNNGAVATDTGTPSNLLIAETPVSTGTLLSANTVAFSEPLLVEVNGTFDNPEENPNPEPVPVSTNKAIDPLARDWLSSQGHEGSLSNSFQRRLNQLGFNSQRNSADIKLLQSLGHNSQLNQSMFNFLRSRGYTGNMNEMLRKYYSDI